MLSPHFRPMYRKDIPDIVKMSRDNMAHIILSSWGVQYRDEDTLEEILKPHVRTEVIEIEGAVAGFFSVEHTLAALFINALQVKKQFQRKGLGRMTMERIERMALTDGLDTVDLWVQSTNRPAMDFYLTLGYKMVMKQGNNFLMRKNLKEA